MSGFRGRRAVLVFYPADREPVCCEKLALYQEYVPTLQGLRAEMVGISAYGTWRHAAFAREIDVRFPLLADSSSQGSVGRAHGLYLEHGESSNRTLLGLDERGLIRRSQAYPIPVNPGIDGILCALENLTSKTASSLRPDDVFALLGAVRTGGTP